MRILIILIIGAFIASAVLKKASESGPAEKVKKLKTVSKLLPVAAIAVLVLSVILGSFYSVSEDQQAVVVMFGKVQRVDGAGVHWKIPYIQTAKKVDITTHGASIGYTIPGSTQTFGEGENPLMITADMNLIDVDFYMEYKVNDAVAYLYNSENPELVLHNSAMSCGRLPDRRVILYRRMGEKSSSFHHFICILRWPARRPARWAKRAQLNICKRAQST